MAEIAEATSEQLVAYVNQAHSGLTVCGDLLLTGALTQNAKDGYVSVTAPLGCWIENVFCRHDERDSKDGQAFIPSNIRGGRKSEHVIDAQWLVYEIDGKMTVKDASKVLGALPYASVLWTTHNHLRRTQGIGVGTFNKWAEPLANSERGVAAFCAQHKNYKHLSNVRLADKGKVFHVKEYGKKVPYFDIAHDPEPKFRIVFPLASPVSMRDPGLGGFKRLYKAHGDAVFGEGVYSSESCNPARIHYLGSHRPGAPYEMALFDAPPLDWRTIKVPPEPVYAPSAMQTTGEGELWHILKSIPPDLPRERWVKCIFAILYEASGDTDGEAIVHAWSEGDPRYRFQETQSVIDSFAPNYVRPARKGSLVDCAKEYDPEYRHYANPVVLVPETDRQKQYAKAAAERIATMMRKGKQARG